MIGKKILAYLLSFFIVFIYTNTLISCFQLDYINSNIRNFKKAGKLDESLSTRFHKVYFVKSDNNFNDDKTYYKDSYNRFYPGGVGDIAITKRTAHEWPLLSSLISFYVGGHAVITDSGFYCIETTGFGDDPSVTMSRKTLFDNNYDEYMAYRVKVKKEVREEAYKAAGTYLHQPYNYSFIFNTKNSKYCSDLISRAYEDVGVYFYNNFIATTVYDLVANPYTYLTYYSNVVDNVRYTYILDDI